MQKQHMNMLFCTTHLSAASVQHLHVCQVPGRLCTAVVMPHSCLLQLSELLTLHGENVSLTTLKWCVPAAAVTARVGQLVRATATAVQAMKLYMHLSSCTSTSNISCVYSHLQTETSPSCGLTAAHNQALVTGIQVPGATQQCNNGSQLIHQQVCNSHQPWVADLVHHHLCSDVCCRAFKNSCKPRCCVEPAPGIEPRGHPT